MQSDGPIRVFVGWDSREPEAFEVCAHSLTRHASIPVTVTPIKQQELRNQKLYWRDRDPLASTEFTYTRFLTPLLAGFQGHALFCDCDFLWTGDIAELVALIDPAKAVSCVQHDHRPPEQTKMDDAIQTRYPRKNWSSLMLFNCRHRSVRQLTAETVNTQTGAYLHRMQWVAEDEVGAIPETWNWLEGWSAKPAQGTPKVIHYTRGGPWFEKWRDADYADLWRDEWARVQSGG
jgi:lipopolysaccharide biosynthesis glycosyltransferase